MKRQRAMVASNAVKVRSLLRTLFLISTVSILMSIAPALASTDPYWGGYEFWASGVPSITEAYAQFSVPTVNPPDTGCSWWNGHCSVAFWLGLTDTGGGEPNGLAQGGVAASITCLFGCGAVDYYAWIQFPGVTGIIRCYNVAPGHTMNVWVTRQSANQFNVAVTDSTTGYACNETRTQSAMNYAIYANYIVEHSPNWVLNNFGTLWFHQSWMQYNGGVHSIKESYDGGYYSQIIIQNTCGGNTYQNINPPSAVQSDPTIYGQFSVQYKTSQCT